ncbi:hypothetical protein ScPMuIL_001805 [Solemya velum]
MNFGSNQTIYYLIIAAALFCFVETSERSMADQTSQLEWSSLPEHIILRILSYLSLQEKYHASLTCKMWHTCFNMPELWRKFSFWFYTPSQKRFLRCVEQFGAFLQSIYIELDQEVKGNRENACTVLESMAETSSRSLSAISIKFTGENPLFYAGHEFVKALRVLFGPVNLDDGFGHPTTHLLSIDLSGLTVQFDDSLLHVISQNNYNLERLNIQNSVIICKVSPDGLLNLVKSCKRLRDLRVYHCSMSESVLLELCAEAREPIEHLSIKCRREDKFKIELPSTAWSMLVRKSPKLHVTLGFDHTCPLDRVADLLDPEIPVRVLLFETFSEIYKELNLAVKYYSSHLEKLVLNTHNSTELSGALRNVGQHCSKLKTLWVYCVLDKELIEELLDHFPEMCKRKSYILKSEMEPEPWLPGFIEEFQDL